jgi:hypothetical protein
VPTPPREQPPVVPWGQFVTRQVASNNAAKRSVDPKTQRVTVEGIHRLFDGRTRSGKTTLNRILLRMKKTVLVLGTKPQDPSLDAYVYREGYTRIDHWPPKPRELKQKGPFEQVKLLLWPEITKYSDLKRFRDLYRNAINDIFVEGAWTLGIDEGLWVCGHKGLDLGDEVSAVAYGGAGNGISLHLVIQRPSGIPVIIHESCHELYQFRTGNTNDIRELASHAGKSSRDFSDAVRSLNGGNDATERRHQFLYAPMTDDGTWEISEVPASWA